MHSMCIDLKGKMIGEEQDFFFLKQIEFLEMKIIICEIFKKISEGNG